MAVFACLVRSDVIETWTHPGGFIRQLRYRKARSGHRVVWDVDRSPFPEYREFPTAEGARRCWRERRAILERMGYAKSDE